MAKRRITSYVDEDLWEKFVSLSVSRSMKEERSAYGAIAKALEEAIKMWIEKQKR